MPMNPKLLRNDIYKALSSIYYMNDTDVVIVMGFGDLFLQSEVYYHS